MRRARELLDDGLSNRAVGERLRISVKTVERHVGSIYLKLGFHSRAQLVARVTTMRAALQTPTDSQEVARG